MQATETSANAPTSPVYSWIPRVPLARKIAGMTSIREDCGSTVLATNGNFLVAIPDCDWPATKCPRFSGRNFTGSLSGDTGGRVDPDGFEADAKLPQFRQVFPGDLYLGDAIPADAECITGFSEAGGATPGAPVELDRFPAGCVSGSARITVDNHNGGQYRLYQATDPTGGTRWVGIQECYAKTFVDGCELDLYVADPTSKKGTESALLLGHGGNLVGILMPCRIGRM